nr:uncharacterized protein LOC129272800 [Lytechinus pictus]
MHSSIHLESSGDSREAKPHPGPIKRRLRSSTSLVSTPRSKVRRKNDRTREVTPSRSPSSASMKTPWVVSESPHGLVIVETKQSPAHSKKMPACELTEAFCSCTDEMSCADSTSAGRKKKTKVRLTKRMDDCCLESKDLSKNGQAKSKSTRRKASKQRKIGSNGDLRAKCSTCQRSNTKIGENMPMQKPLRTDDHPNYFLKDSENLEITCEVISHTSEENFKEEDDSEIVRQLIHQRIDETLITQNDPKNDTSSMKPSVDVVMSTDNSLAKLQLMENDTKTKSQCEIESTTVTNTAAAEAAKAVGGISLVPLLKSKHPDFVSTVSSPCTLTMTVMKASSGQIISSTTMPSESNLKASKTKMSDDLRTPQIASSISAPSVASVPQKVAQCKYVASTSTVPTPSTIKAGNVITTGQPILLSSEAFQIQPVSYPGYKLLDISSSVPVTKEPKPKRKRNSGKKKSLDKKAQSLHSGNDSQSLTVVSISTISSPTISESSADHLDTDHTRSDVKDPSLDEKGEKIKRPMNAFMIWSRQQRAILARQKPRMTNAEISVKLGIMWNDLDYNIKQEYFDEAIQLKLQHRKDHPDWVYQPRPHKRPSRRKHLAVPMFGGENQSMPYNQMVLIMADGQEVLCPAIPVQTSQRHGSMMTMKGPAKNIKDVKTNTKSKEQVPKAVTITTDSNVTPKPTVEVVEKRKNAAETKKQTKSKMPAVVHNEEQAICQSNPQEGSQGTTTHVRNIQNSNQNNNQPKPQLLLVLPDGRHVLCPQASNSPAVDAKVMNKTLGLSSDHSIASEEKMLIRVKSEKGGERKTIIPLKSLPGLANATNLGPEHKDTADPISKAVLPPVSIPEEPVSSEDDQKTTETVNMATSTRMSVPTMKSETPDSDHAEFMKTPIYAQTAHCGTPSAVGKVEFSKEGVNQSVAKLPNQMGLQLSNLNQQSPLMEMNSLQMQPTNYQMPIHHVVHSSWGIMDSSRLLPDVQLAQVGFQQSVNNQIPMQHVNGTMIGTRSQPDVTLVPFNLQGSVNQVPIQQLGNSFKVTTDPSRPHSNNPLIPQDLQEPVASQQPVCKNTAVQTLQDWSYNVPTTQSHTSQFPSSVLKTQPIDMVWHPDTRILQPANMSNKGTSTSSLSHPFYFTPIPQDQGGQDTSPLPPVCPKSLPATTDSCTVPSVTGNMKNSDPSGVAIPAPQFSDTPALCEINESDRLLESLAMSGVGIGEDEAEETENLFQRVMSMVSNN